MNEAGSTALMARWIAAHLGAGAVSVLAAYPAFSGLFKVIEATADDFFYVILIAYLAGLLVIPSETARRLRDSTPTQVARELRVDSVLTGNVRVNGDRLLVRIELSDGATGFITWTFDFDEAFDDIFKVQTRIAQGVAAQLGHGLTGEAAEILARTESSSKGPSSFVTAASASTAYAAL